MIADQGSSTGSETTITYLVGLKTEVLNFLNGEPRLSYSEFYNMYGEAKAYFLTRQTEDPALKQTIARMPALEKPSPVYIPVRKLKSGCAEGSFSAYFYTSLLFAAAPLTLPLLLAQTYQERKIRLQLFKLYNTLEKLLWRQVSQ